MGLNFSSILNSTSGENQIGNIFVAQGATPITITYTFAGSSEETVYTVPAGQTLYISKIHLIGVETAYNLEIGGNQIFLWTTTAGASTKEIDFACPIAVSAGTVISCTSVANKKIAIIGWIQ